jgi:hypothetical protein
MLINLSNHPISSWSQSQIDEAVKLYSRIVDLEFPHISPHTGEKEIALIAKKYKDECLELLKDNKDTNNAVHIMGELTFCFALISALLKENIPCVASTTVRDSLSSADSKISRFNFVKFRNYLV